MLSESASINASPFHIKKKPSGIMKPRPSIIIKIWDFFENTIVCILLFKLLNVCFNYSDL